MDKIKIEIDERYAEDIFFYYIQNCEPIDCQNKKLNSFFEELKIIFIEIVIMKCECTFKNIIIYVDLEELNKLFYIVRHKSGFFEYLQNKKIKLERLKKLDKIKKRH